MDSDRQLRTEVVSALEAVTPPAPWLASTIRDSLHASPRRGGLRATVPAGFAARGLLPALAVALVLLLLGTVVGVFAMRSFARPVPAHHADSDVTRYAAFLTQEKQLLDEAAGRVVLIGADRDQCIYAGSPNQPAAVECVTHLSRLEGGYQRWLDDLGHTAPPARFAAEQARMQGDLQAMIAVVRLEIVNNSPVVPGTPSPTIANNLSGNASAADGQLRDDLLTIEAYVISESARETTVRDAATTAYVAGVARDYDNLGLPTLFISLLTCFGRPGPECTGPAATTRSATEAFLTDLQASTPPAQFAVAHRDLISALQSELRSLDEVDAAYLLPPQADDPAYPPFPFPDPAVFRAVADAINTHGSISTFAGRILYAH